MIQTKDLEDDKNSKKSITPKDNRTLDASEIKKINLKNQVTTKTAYKY